MNVSDWIEENWNIHSDIQINILLSLIAILILWTLRSLAFRLVFKRVKDPKSRYYWRNGIKNTYLGLLLVVISGIWVDRFDSLATFLGLVTAGLTIALQVPIVNFAGWIFLVIRKPFEVGDRIEIGNIAGDVIDIRFFQFTLNEINNWVDADQSTGRIIHVPNGKIFKDSQANYSQGFSHIWNEIGVLVTFESDWRKAKSILEKIVNSLAENMSEAAEKKLLQASEKYMIFYSKLTPIVYTSVKDSGVMLTMRFLCHPKKRRGTEQEMWEAILDEVAKHDDIDFAYPTQRIYYNAKEGKDGARKGE